MTFWEIIVGWISVTLIAWAIMFLLFRSGEDE